MLFSGTARRAVVTKLADYRNIFLAASKPNLFAGNHLEQVDAFINSWHSEINFTKGLIGVQRKLLQLNTLGDGAETTTEPAIPYSSTAEQQEHRHFTIAIDESGDFAMHPHSAVGGIVIEATADRKSEAQFKTFEFLEALRSAGVHFYDHVPAYTELRKIGKLVALPCIPKGKRIQHMVSDVKPQHMDCRLGSFRCLIPKHLYTRL